MNFSKLINHGKDSRAKILAGTYTLYDLVSSTLGPGGRFIAIKRSSHPLDVPFLTKDGKTVAENIFLKDEFEDAGAAMVKDAAIQTCKEVGDATTTATVLAYHIYKQGIEAIEAGANPVLLKKGMDAAVQAATEAIKEMKTNVVGDDIQKVSRISANGDAEMADLVAQAVVMAGQNGTVEISRSDTTETKIRQVDGCQLNSGWITPRFITDEKTGEAVLEKPYILLFDKKIQSISDMLPFLEKVSDQNRSILIIAENLEGEALATLVFNKVQGVLRSCAIRTPGYKEMGRELLEDIAALTGATVIGDDLGLKLSSVGFEHLGEADLVKVGQEYTSILGGHANAARLQDRIEEIHAAKTRETDQSQLERLQLRLSRLSGGIVVIQIGGATQLEVEEKFYRAEDAMHAVRAALEGGIVPGGGVALLRASNLVFSGKAPTVKDEEKGRNIIVNAMTAPIQKIATNAGFDHMEVLNTVSGALTEGFGFNAMTGEYGDMKEMGIVDPAKVVLAALKNAASIASNMLLCEGMVVPPVE